MLRLKCNCGKPLAVGEIQCNLCAAGFAPARQVDLAISYQSEASVSTSEYSGINCPRCHAKLSVAEVAVSTCSHCHAMVATEVIPTAVPVPRGLQLGARRAPEAELAGKAWPGDKAYNR